MLKIRAKLRLWYSLFARKSFFFLFPPHLKGECDPSYGADFVFEIHAKELIVGDIFVRIFNDQPMFVLEVGIQSHLIYPEKKWFVVIRMCENKMQK